jgi:hypothetical protein
MSALALCGQVIAGFWQPTLQHAQMAIIPFANMPEDDEVE